MAAAGGRSAEHSSRTTPDQGAPGGPGTPEAVRTPEVMGTPEVAGMLEALGTLEVVGALEAAGTPEALGMLGDPEVLRAPRTPGAPGAAGAAGSRRYHELRRHEVPMVNTGQRWPGERAATTEACAAGR